MKHLMKTCPRCGKETFVRSVFGSICGNDECFYEEKEELKNKEDENGKTNYCEACEARGTGGLKHTCGQTPSFLDKDWVSDCCRSSMSEVKNGGVSPFKCNHCGKRCQPKQLKNQGLEINKLRKTMNKEDIIKKFRDFISFERPDYKLAYKFLMQGQDGIFREMKEVNIEQFILKKVEEIEIKHSAVCNKAITLAIEEAREDGITAGMDLVKATYEANKEAWEKKAREEVKKELREKAEEMKTDGSNQLFSNRNLNYSDGYNQAIENILKLIN